MAHDEGGELGSGGKMLLRGEISVLKISRTGPEVKKRFSCSTQLSMEFEMLIRIKISSNLAYIWLR